MDITYKECATVDLHKSWCPTELSSSGEIVSWGFCQPHCPSEEIQVACLEEPQFPKYATGDDFPMYGNFTTTYVKGSDVVTLEVISL